MKKKKPEQVFNKAYEEAKKDPNIIGFFSGGSRGKGKKFITKYSDYDIYIIVKDKAAKSYKKKFEKIKAKDVDFAVFSYSDFKKYAALGTPYEWNRYNFAHLKVLIDKNKKIQKLVDEKGKIPKNRVKKFINGNLDGYINAVYRSIKCWRDGDKVGARLEAIASIPIFLKVAFALHDRRLRPYYKYLKWELEKFPLKKFPMSSKQLLNNIFKIIETGDLKTQQKLFKLAEKVSRKHGYGKIFNSWGKDHLNWMKTLKLK